MIAFKEQQKFTQWWLWLLLIGVGIPPIVGLYQQLIQNKTYSDSSLSMTGLAIYTIVIVLLIALFLILTLKTEINSQGIHMHYIPFVKKHTAWKDIENVEIINYGFVGGWGIRWGTDYGTVYNTKGNKGLAITLKTGKTFVIGSQKEDELIKVIEKVKSEGLI